MISRRKDSRGGGPSRQLPMLRIAFATVVALLLLVLLVAAAFPVGWLRGAAEDRLSSRYGAPVQIGSLSRTQLFSFHPEIVVQDIRIYDLPERVLPRAVLDMPTPDIAKAQRTLIDRSAYALGVATAADLRDYYQLKPDEADHAITDLAEAGLLIPVRVEGWSQRAWMHRDVRLPRRVTGRPGSVAHLRD